MRLMPHGLGDMHHAEGEGVGQELSEAEPFHSLNF